LWLKALYGVLVVSASAMAVMLVQELIKAFEDTGPHEHGLHDAAIFDAAWPVFVVSGLFTLVAAVVMLIVGGVRRSRPALRYSAWAMGFCVLSIGLLAIFG
jgi:hypothetical protein